MYIYFRCTDCDQKIKTNFQHRGEEIDCPTCQLTLDVPYLPVGPGVMINGYLIEEKVGDGGMGTVYRAIQRSMNRPAALKILAPYLTYEETSVERFLKEAHTMASLRHPHLVAAYDAGSDDDVYYIAMEYVQGDGLDEHLRASGPMADARALELTRKLADGLHYAWKRKKMIHRDVKPANIMIDTEEEPRLLDLGLARSLDSVSRLTLSGEILGTPDYMSPEQERGEFDTDFRSDIFSLGATLYSMLTGDLPVRIPEEPVDNSPRMFADPRLQNPDISPACIDLLAGMLGRSPDDRQSEWENVIAEIDSASRDPQSRISRPKNSFSLLAV